LELATTEPITRQTANAHILKVVPLTKEEKEEKLKSGMYKIANRVGWAMSHLKKAGLIEKVAKATYGATSAGMKFLEKHKGEEISYETLKEIEGFLEAWKSAGERNRTRQVGKTKPLPVSDLTPEEAIDQAVEEVESNLRSELLVHLGSVDPYRFEQVVIDLLFAMGYGGSRKEAAQVTKRSNDEGIDGIINEDRLGLDVIYVQAKRWQSVVGRKEIQSFVGALAGKQANKGVFITTSGFTQNAVEFADNVQQKVVLIDGERLSDLMVEHDVGVSTSRTIAVKTIDTDYFEEN